MTRRQRVITVGSAFAWLMPTVLWASPHVAQEAGADPHGGGIEWVTPILGHEGKIGLLWILVNFAVLVWLLEKLLFSKLRARTREKHDTIKGELEKAQAARKEAESLVGDYQSRIDRLEGELEELMEDAKRRAESERQKIIAAAQADAERIRASAKAAAEREAESRRRQIENEIVDRAVERAETAIRQRLTSTDQRRIVDDYITQLSGVDFGAGASGGAR